LLLASCNAFAQAVTIEVSPAMQDVKRGEAPRFIVTVRATGQARIADIVSRPDFRDRLVSPRISGTSAADDLAISLKELGPVGAADYLVLEPGNSFSFESDGSPRVLQSLTPGDYKLVLRYKPNWDSAAIQSNAVTFRVTP
jgi:hypothetical protein